MKPVEPEFTLGIEEEYLLVDRRTRALAAEPPQSLLGECEEEVGKQVSSELQRSQIEVGTRVCHSLQDVRDELMRLRKSVIEVTARHGLAPIAASTHPFSSWFHQKQTQKERYEMLTAEMQAAARRLVICGMHVHVGIDDEELRIDLMNQLTYFLPHLLAMSCSSPFWGGHDTGFKSYRLTIFDALPRTGIPERFQSFAEYRRHIDLLIDAGLIEDSTKIWWDLRPSGRYPTLETRVMDVCTRLDDAIALSALLVCILRMLYRLRVSNQRWRIYSPLLIKENRWRAMRYSFDEGLLDLGRGRVVPFEVLLDELLHLVEDDAQALGCTREVASLEEILKRGTSAHRQLDAYRSAQAAGADRDESLEAVVDLLVSDTAAGLDAPADNR
ncbi:MAG: carboxylate-amine ligase [Gammaproteobacteria bacterium]|nr:carboxylate-amine ligase [Gammaproteobacteria bacterium]